jgi:hypothetical protein
MGIRFKVNFAALNLKTDLTTESQGDFSKILQEKRNPPYKLTKFSSTFFGV